MKTWLIIAILNQISKLYEIDIKLSQKSNNFPSLGFYLEKIYLF